MAGEIITIEGWPARDGSRYLRMRVAHRADGTVIACRWTRWNRNEAPLACSRNAGTVLFGGRECGRSGPAPGPVRILDAGA